MGWFRAVWGHSRSWAMPPFDRARTNSYSTLIKTMRLSCTVFEIFRASYLSKVAYFYPPHLHLAPPQGVIPVKFRDLWHQKTRVPRLSCGVVFVILRLAVLIELRLVTDGQMDRQTDTGPWLVPRMHSIKTLFVACKNAVKTLFVACAIHDV